jgi:predicted component of type VI protein secretion system
MATIGDGGMRLLLGVICLVIAGCSGSSSTPTPRATEVVELTAQPEAAPDHFDPP